MSDWDDETDCAADDGDYDDYGREERDYINGFCRECDTWGAFQCRMHGDDYIEAARAEHERVELVLMSRRGKRTKAGRKARFRLSVMGWQS